MSKIKKWLIPEDRGEWVITVGWLLFAASYLARIIFFPELEDSILSFPLKWVLLRRIEAIGLVVGISPMIILSIRKIRMFGFGSRSLINLSVGILMAAIFIMISTFSYYMFQKISKSLFWPDHMIAEFEEKINSSDLEPERKSLLSIIVARNNYQKNGQLSPYLDKEGMLRQYEPTSEDKEVRKTALFIKSLVSLCKKNAYFWSGILIISVILGVVTPVKRHRELEQKLTG